MTTFPLRLPEDLKAEAAAQAEAAGVSLNQYIVSALAGRVGAQAETERYFRARAARAKPGALAKALALSGRNEPRPDDRLDAE